MQASEQANIIRRILKGEYVIPDPPLAAGVPVGDDTSPIPLGLLAGTTAS
jgi:hypothetical protein